MKQELVITGAALALVLGGAGVASAAPGGDPVFANCSEARAAGQTDIPQGSPAYAEALDRDADGFACDAEDRGADDTGLDDTDLDADRPTEGTAEDHEYGDHEDGDHEYGDHGKGDDEQVSVVPEGGAPTGDGSTEGRTGWWVGGGLLTALAGAGLAFRRRLAGLAGR